MSTVNKTIVSVTPAIGLDRYYYRASSQDVWKNFIATPGSTLQETIEQMLGLGYKVKHLYEKDGTPLTEYVTVDSGTDKYDYKIGSFGVMNSESYTIAYGRRSTSMKKSKVTVKGVDLYAKLRDLHAKNNNGFIVNDVVIHPSAFSESAKDKKAQTVDPVVNSTNEPRSLANGAFRLDTWRKGYYTWFSIYHNGNKLVTKEAILQAIPNFFDTMRDLLGREVLYSTHNPGSLYIKHIVEESDLLAAFQLLAKNTTLSTPEPIVTPESKIVLTPAKVNGEDPAVAVSGKVAIDPETQDHTIKNFAKAVVPNAAIIEIDAKIEALEKVLDMVSDDAKSILRTTISNLLIAKRAIA